jgi:hypothetical protein
MDIRTLAAIGFATALGVAANAQVVFNEILENPPGTGEEVWEYIELYGRPGMSLTGYAIALVKGGNESGALAEVDEAYQLDGLTIGSNGFLVLHNNTGGPSFIPARCSPGTTIVTYTARHIPTTDTAGNLANDDSSTYILVRKRPFHSISGSSSVYAPGYSWRKDVDPDVDYNSRLDSPGHPVGGPAMEAYQMVDDASWSHNAGKEYTRDNQQEISTTEGFNPDCLVRVEYYGKNAQRGHRFNSEGEITWSRMADEEFVYGDLISVPGLAFDPARSDGPTDPNGPTYDGSCDPDRDTPTEPCSPNPSGTYLFDPINLSGFALTPGNFNDGGASGIVQFRWVIGDFDFNGVADTEDLHLINQRLGATLDDTEMVTDDNNTPEDPLDDFTYTGWKWQGRDFNALLAMMDMSTTDGAGGANATSVTGADIAAHMALVRTGEYNDMANGRR